MQPALAFIQGRHAADERATLVAVPPGARRGGCAASASPPAGLPIVHILIPSDFRDADGGARRATLTHSWANLPGGLDGIALDLPALAVKPTHGEFFPLNIQVKDPIWPLRNMLDVSVSVRPGRGRGRSGSTRATESCRTTRACI